MQLGFDKALKEQGKMKRRLAIAGILLSVFGSSSAPLSARGAGTATKTIILYTGIVDSKSAERLMATISRNTDKVIGLKITVERSVDSDEEYYSSLDGQQLNITSGNPMAGPVEVIINGGVGRTGAGAFFTVDGFYLIKSGGSHAAGAISFGALPVSEATIRLDPKIRIVTKSF